MRPTFILGTIPKAPWTAPLKSHLHGYPMGPLEGILAINKPSGISSAEALRKLQDIFNPSEIFADTLEAERRRRDAESRNQKKRRRGPNAKQVNVKIGHGGTLDPMARGILIAGIGAGTKRLSGFLGCTKTYEATAMFGCETDTYDALGKVVKRAGWLEIDREKVEDALGRFRGDIMQIPPIYSALHMNGKRLYEYAREGKPLPAEIPARPVRAESLELLDFTFDHEYKFPKEEVSEEEKILIGALEKQIHPGDDKAGGAVGEKRVRSESPHVPNEKVSKKQKRSIPEGSEGVADVEAVPVFESEGNPLAVTLRMTVTSGFYVRSLIHDLGRALGSAAHMVKLVRSRQGDYELGGENTLEWDELMNRPEDVWGPKVEGILRKWSVEREQQKR